jgi:hypothetical protein
MNDADLRQRLDALTAKVPAQPDAYGLVQTRATRIRRRRASAGIAAVVCVAVVAVAVPVALRSGPSRHVAATPADGVVTHSCERTAFDLALRLGPTEAVYGVRLTAGVAAHWIDPTTFRPDPVFAALPPTEQVSFCLVVGQLDALTDPDPADTPGAAHVVDAHVALVSVVRGRASARYVGGPDYSLLAGQPAPGIPKSAVAPFVVLNGLTVASAAPSQVAAARRCGSSELIASLAFDGLPDGLPEWSVTVRNTSGATCSIFADLRLAALDGRGAPLPVPTDGVLARMRASGVLQPHGANALRVTIYGDTSANLCAKPAVMTPARLVLSLGTATVSVTNRAASTVKGRDAVSGCPNRIYAGGAQFD